jgi:hypothetical protein
MATKGLQPADITRLLGVSRQSVYAALQRQAPGEAHYQGKDGCRITVRLNAELCAAVGRAQRADETRTDTITRLLEKALGR